ncbi:hypothetical protein LCGC14_0195600 [marine sediment metagenome]|uniref:Uncharacterized protein n=1 Tax=marine sediment metagenome TaxID=412755 RepID=A0A0F9V1X9_9ZZZZ
MAYSKTSIIENLSKTITRLEKKVSMAGGKKFSEISEIETELNQLKTLQKQIGRFPNDLFENLPESVIDINVITRTDLLFSIPNGLLELDTNQYNSFISLLKEQLKSGLRKESLRLIRDAWKEWK